MRPRSRTPSHPRNAASTSAAAMASHAAIRPRPPSWPLDVGRRRAVSRCRSRLASRLESPHALRSSTATACERTPTASRADDPPAARAGRATGRAQSRRSLAGQQVALEFLRLGHTQGANRPGLEILAQFLVRHRVTPLPSSYYATAPTADSQRIRSCGIRRRRFPRVMPAGRVDIYL